MAVIPNQGLITIANLLCGLSTDAFKYIAIGTENSNTNLVANALNSEITDNDCERKLANISVDSDGTISWEYIFIPSTTEISLGEVGIFSKAITDGDMMMRDNLISIESLPPLLECKVNMSLKLVRT